MNTRRDFLKRCGLAGLGFSVPMSARMLLGDQTEEELPAYNGPYYVVFNASGG